MSSATASAGAEGRVGYHGSVDTFESHCFKNIVHSNGNQLSIYCLQSPELVPEGFRHESDPVPSFSGPNSSRRLGQKGTERGGVGPCGSCSSRGRSGSSRPSVSRLSVRRQACISKIMERQEGAAVSAHFLPPSSSVYLRLALVTARP